MYAVQANEHMEDEDAIIEITIFLNPPKYVVPVHPLKKTMYINLRLPANFTYTHGSRDK